MIIYTSKDIARMLGLSETTVRKYAKIGLLPGFFVGKKVYFLEEEFKTFVKNGGRKFARI